LVRNASEAFYFIWIYNFFFSLMWVFELIARTSTNLTSVSRPSIYIRSSRFTPLETYKPVSILPLSFSFILFRKVHIFLERFVCYSYEMYGIFCLVYQIPIMAHKKVTRYKKKKNDIYIFLIIWYRMLFNWECIKIIFFFYF
jgi:hypothetical protein